MNLLQLERPGSLRLKDTPLPKAGPEESILKVTHCAVCRTDAKMWDRGHRDLVLPRVLGHEICGYLEDSGKYFVVWPGKACGYCAQCKAGAENLCESMQILGFHRDGGFAEYVVVPKSSLLPVPHDLPGKVACLAEPIACAINALDQANLISGSHALIYGGGPVGLLMALTVKARGANPLIMEISSAKLGRSEEFRNKVGIKAALQPSRSHFDIVINATSSIDVFAEGLNRLQDGGMFCFFSAFTDCSPVPADLLNEIHYRQLKCAGAYGCTRKQMKEAVETLLNYRDEVELLIEGDIGLDQVSSVLPRILGGQVLKFVINM